MNLETVMPTEGDQTQKIMYGLKVFATGYVLPYAPQPRPVSDLYCEWGDME
jgi:hypothetical protein